jgi:hypothetical protein
LADILQTVQRVSRKAADRLCNDHIDISNKSFNDMEGDSDKWARTIISWLKQVDWVVDGERIDCCGTMYDGSIPSRIVADLIRYGYDGRKSSTLFEMTVNSMFKFLGYESEHLGEGKGRVADVIAKYRSHLYAKSYGIIIDAKAYQKYNFPAGDLRKMKEYISLHGEYLLEEKIPRHVFAFISMDFTNEEAALSEVARDTAVNGTAITVDTLLKLGEMVTKQEVNIADIYDWYNTNKRFALA